MKSHFVFFISVITAFIASFFVPLWSGKIDDDLGNELDDSKSLVGKKAIVTECVTTDAGKVRLSNTNWGARLSEECSATSLAPGVEVTIKRSEKNVLYVY